ncbi:Transmembrane protein [Quillaja saponaria]|uniref:Transmembrane protein n=1 Tax=Quillaja saponaria TaxID=32244 RepID=A0AAD7Q2H0_QUISA|nr:Transmembrane protein [Quillaja saponaria]
MGISVNDLPRRSSSHHRTQKVFLLCNYILLGAASSCIFLTLSLRLIPSICGFLLILLHVFTIIGAVSGCATASSWTSRWYSAHMVATVLTAILQGSVSVLIITRTGDFLGEMKSYVREEDGSVILKLAGGLSILIFCLDWMVLTLAFFLKYYASIEGDGIGVGGVNTMSLRRSAKVQQDEDLKDWPWPFQV